MIVFLIFLVEILSGVSCGYIETVEVRGCEHCQIFLTCRHLGAVLAILQAEFYPSADENNTIPSNEITTVFPPFHPRQALNRRCSGVNHCSFVLNEDCPGADKWGPGQLWVQYVCITEDHMKKYCKGNINLTEQKQGFIHNPGYPRFYPGQKQCQWKIKTEPNQKIQIKILDLAITAIGNEEPDCSLSPERLEIIDTGIIALSTCHQTEPPQVITSTSNELDIILHSSRVVNPQRGFLLHYTTIGCFQHPPLTLHSYIVSRNDSHLHVACCVGLAFADTGYRNRILTCREGSWSEDTLPECSIKVDTTTEFEFARIQHVEAKIMSAEFVAPALLIVALFLINSVVLFYIYKAKQKNAFGIKDEELGALQLQETSNPRL